MEAGLLKLDVYGIAHDLAVQIHRMTMALPSFERFEEGSQVRRSSKRVSACIVEGHTLRKYKALFLNFLYRALASSDETQEHLKLLKETGSLADDMTFKSLFETSSELSRKLFRFIQGVEQRHETPQYLAGSELDTLETDEESEELFG